MGITVDFLEVKNGMGPPPTGQLHINSGACKDDRAV